MTIQITKGYTFGSTELVTNTKLNSLVDDAAIVYVTNAQLNQIVTASKVSGAALTLLGDIPAAGGVVPSVNLNTSALVLLSATTVALNADADTTIYTVPAGKRCILSHAILVAGADGAETDFIPAKTLSNLDNQYDCVILQPEPAEATKDVPLKNKSYAAATVIQAKVANQSGGATNTLYLYGMLY
jgi:hypothetical protein